MAGTIAAVEARTIALPLARPFRFATFELRELPYTWLRVSSTSGLVGFGEAPTYWDPTGETQLAAVGAAQLWEPMLVGLPDDDVIDLSRIAATLAPGALAARCALEAALLDMRGKLDGVSVSRVLGGSGDHRSIRVNAVLGLEDDRDLEGALELGRMLVSRGYDVLKIKVSRESRRRDLELVAHLRAEHADLRMFVDANQSWPTPKDALRDLSALADAGIDHVEQPLHATDLAGHAFLRERLPIEIILDESVLTATDLLRARDAGAIDAVNIKLAKAGGPFSAVKMAHVAETLGIPVVLGSMVEGSLGMLANYHAAQIIEPMFAGVSVYADVNDGLNPGIDVSKGTFELRDPLRPGLGYDETALTEAFEITARSVTSTR